MFWGHRKTKTSTRRRCRRIYAHIGTQSPPTCRQRRLERLLGTPPGTPAACFFDTSEKPLAGRPEITEDWHPNGDIGAEWSPKYGQRRTAARAPLGSSTFGPNRWPEERNPGRTFGPLAFDLVERCRFSSFNLAALWCLLTARAPHSHRSGDPNAVRHFMLLGLSGASGLYPIPSSSELTGQQG